MKDPDNNAKGAETNRTRSKSGLRGWRLGGSLWQSGCQDRTFEVDQEPGQTANGVARGHGERQKVWYFEVTDHDARPVADQEFNDWENGYERVQ